MRYGLYKKTHFENFGNRAFCQRTAVWYSQVSQNGRAVS